MDRKSEGRDVCLAYVGIACCLRGGLLCRFHEGPEGLSLTRCLALLDFLGATAERE